MGVSQTNTLLPTDLNVIAADMVVGFVISIRISSCSDCGAVTFMGR